MGGIHEQAIIGLPPQLAGLLTMLGGTAPLPNQSDTKLFFGAGGGFDINLAPVGLRFTVDWVDTHLFSNLLTGRQNYARFTVGPVFKWGQLQ